MRVSCFQCELRACGAFKPVSDMELAFINEMKRDHLKLDAGTEFIAAGRDQAELYTLYAGWAFRHKTLPDGRRQILNIHLPGDLIGLQGAMFEAPAYSVEALTEVQLCLLPRRKIWSLFENMPELSFDVT
jgi:CRP-like cAMP-binding protein